jgi:hypothetical protein
MSVFTPCKGKTACRDDGDSCLTCGRSFEAIGQTRQLIEALAELACAQGYDNVDEFTAYIARKVGDAVRYRRKG